MIGSLPSNIGRGLNNKKPLDKHRSIRERTHTQKHAELKFADSLVCASGKVCS